MGDSAIRIRMGVRNLSSHQQDGGWRTMLKYIDLEETSNRNSGDSGEEN